jgi:glutathione S-transferase
VFPVAPNPTKVSLYLAEKRARGASLDVETVSVDLARGEQQAPEHRARNPLARLPVLGLDDGTYLLESLAIIEYLEELYPEPPMIGTTPLERARVRALERIVDTGILAPVAIVVHTTNSPLGAPPSPEIAARFRQRLPSALGYLDGQLADGRPFVAGDTPSIADCTLAAALQFGRFGKVDLGTEYTHLHRWDRAYRERDAVRKVFVV